MTTMLALALSATVLSAQVPSSVQAGGTTALGRQCASDFHEGRHEELWARMTPGARWLNVGMGAALRSSRSHRRCTQMMNTRDRLVARKSEAGVNVGTPLIANFKPKPGWKSIRQWLEAMQVIAAV